MSNVLLNKIYDVMRGLGVENLSIKTYFYDNSHTPESIFHGFTLLDIILIFY